MALLTRCREVWTMLARKISRQPAHTLSDGTNVEYEKFATEQRKIDDRVSAQLVRYRTRAITVTVRKTNHDHHHS